MQKIPSISNQLDEENFFEIINNNFSTLAPAYYTLITSWLIDAYKVYKGIDKFIILIYLINKDFIFYRKNGLTVDYDTFYKDKSLEIPNINIIDISKDLRIPRESVRRKIEILKKQGVIKKNGKKIFVDRSAFITAKADKTLKNLSILVFEFSKILKGKNIIDDSFDVDEISKSIKESFSFCWYQFYKFLFIFTNRWKADTKTHDLETICIGFIVLINTVQNKNFKNKNLGREKYLKELKKSDHIGINAFSIADISGIPRATVVRKLKFLIQNNFLIIDEKKLYTFGLGTQSKQYNVISKLQDKNMNSLSQLLYKISNQIKVINKK
ncbi:MarR family transcriptional regulator [Candidatus Pelagibacter sp.]|nr:MarR family transcriptional regulator [Candidatus Pelagibacter sp.]